MAEILEKIYIYIYLIIKTIIIKYKRNIKYNRNIKLTFNQKYTKLNLMTQTIFIFVS